MLLKEAANLQNGVSDDEPAESIEGVEWDGIENVPDIDHEAEYIDENKHTTITIEAVDVSKEGLHRVAGEAEGDAEYLSDTVQENGKLEDPSREETSTAQTGKRKWTKERPPGPKKRKKKFHYESKADRKVTRRKEKSRNKAQAKARKA